MTNKERYFLIENDRCFSVVEENIMEQIDNKNDVPDGLKLEPIQFKKLELFQEDLDKVISKKISETGKTFVDIQDDEDIEIFEFCPSSWKYANCHPQEVAEAIAPYLTFDPDEYLFEFLSCYPHETLVDKLLSDELNVANAVQEDLFEKIAGGILYKPSDWIQEKGWEELQKSIIDGKVDFTKSELTWLVYNENTEKLSSITLKQLQKQTRTHVTEIISERLECIWKDWEVYYWDGLVVKKLVEDYLYGNLK